MAKLIFGCGYLGSRVARRWLDAGETVFAVTRTDNRAATFAEQGIRPIVADVTQADSLGSLPAADTVLFAVGFDRNAGPSMREVYVQGLRNVLSALPPATRRFIYISSTGVYGQTDGRWVDEDSDCHPTREGGRVTLAAEATLRASPLWSGSMILRLAGIYGPGRVPRLDNVIDGRPVPAAPDGYLNLIHVEDAARAVLAAETCEIAGDVLNISDGHPMRRREFYEELARLLDVPPPGFVVPPADSPSAQRGLSDKRVSNQRTLKRLGLSFNFPTYREGLACLVARRA